MTATVAERAWLAGLWDGEGSIGLGAQNKRNGRGERIEGRATSIMVRLQLCMTCERTIRHAGNVLVALGARGLAYTYQEKKPEKHQDAFHLRVNRMIDAILMAEAVMPYAVTKREHWQVLLRFLKLRLDQATIDALGRVSSRGYGRAWTAYGPEEWECYDELHRLNKRGFGGGRLPADLYGPVDLTRPATGEHMEPEPGRTA
jgi:hypothetical protein